MSAFDVFFDPSDPVEKLGPPQLVASLLRSDARVWSGAALAPCLPQLEQMLVRSPSAPVALDRLIGLDAASRGSSLVEACMIAVKERPDIGRYIRGAGEALKADKTARTGLDLGMAPAMRPVQRGVAVLVRGAHATDAMDSVAIPS